MKKVKKTKNELLLLLIVAFPLLYATNPYNCTNVINSSVTNNTIIYIDTHNCTFDNATNLTYFPQKLNISKTLNYSGNYTDSYLNVTVFAPDFPTIDSVDYLNCGENITLTDYNYTVVNNCSQTSTSCLQNLTWNLGYGETKSNSVCNITATAPAENICPVCNTTTCNYSSVCGVNKTLNYGDTYYKAECGINIVAPAPCKSGWIGILKNLNPGETYNNTEAGITISCAPAHCHEFNPNTDCSGWCLASWLPKQKEAWATNKNNTNCTKTEFEACKEDASKYCTFEELFSNNIFTSDGCIHRLLKEKENKISALTKSGEQTKLELTSLKNALGFKENKQKLEYDFIDSVALAIIGIVIIFFILKRGEIPAHIKKSLSNFKLKGKEEEGEKK